VFAALSVEVLPDLLHHRSPVATAIGFTLGTACMLGVKALTGHGEGEDEHAHEGGGAPGATGRLPWSYLAAVGIDLLIDGLLLGVGFVAAARTGKLLAVALSLELLSLGLATTARLMGEGIGRAKTLGVGAAQALVPAVGVALGVTLFGGVGESILAGVLAFAVAALLYLVTEELLTEAHEVPETPATTALFFAGFLALLLLDMVVPGHG
jgi:ZIP family zinc transporter